MTLTTKEKLQETIAAELGDAIFYRRMADMTEDESARKLLAELSSDEQRHADMFGRIYKAMFGKVYLPQAPEHDFSKSFDELLRRRVLSESADFRKYALDWLSPSANRMLRDACFRASVDENVHALTVLCLLDQMKK